MSDTNNKKNSYSNLRGFHRAVPIILLAASVFIALCFVTQDTGAFGQAISGVLLGLFSHAAYLLPILIALHAIFYAEDFFKSRILSRVIFSLVALITVSAFLYTVSTFSSEAAFTPALYYQNGTSGIGGGFIGSIIAYGIMKIFGPVGLIIIAVAVLLLYISYFFAKGKSPAKFFLSILSVIASFFAVIERKIKGLFAKRKERRQKKAEKKASIKSLELCDDDFFAVDNGMRELSIPQLGISESRSRADLEERPNLSESVHHKSEVDASVISDAQENFKASDEPRRKRTVDFSYDGTLYEDTSAPARKTDDIVYESSDEHKNYGLDQNAKDVFTRDFDPLDFATNSQLAAKPSSHIPPVEDAVIEYADPLSNISEEDIARARRNAEFEMKKKALADMYRRQEEARREAEAAAPSNESPIQKTIEFRESETESLGDSAHGLSFSSTVEKPIYENPIYKEPISEEPKYENPVYEEQAPKEDAGSAANFSFETAPEAGGEDLIQPFTAPLEYVSPSYQAEAREDANPILIERTTLPPEPIYEEEDELEYEDELDEEELEYEDEIPGEENPEDKDGISVREIPESEQNEDVKEFRRMFTIFDDDKPRDGGQAEKSNDEDDAPPFDIDETPAFITKPAPAPQPQKEEPPKPKLPDYKSFKMPSLDLMAKGVSDTDEGVNEEIQENSEKLIDTLASFRVTASIKSVDHGPRITRYEVVPARGVKVSAVTNLFDDIALALAADGIRMEAPIPGKSAIGFEIPNKKPSTVYLRDLLETDDFSIAPSKTYVAIGKDVTGAPVFGDIAKMPHLLVAGATGMGKSVCINSILVSMLYKARPDEVKFIMIDPKKVEFQVYNGIPHLLVPVVTDPKQAAGALSWAVEQMEKRYEMIEKLDVRNIEAYNAEVARDPSLGEPMPKIVIVIDELNDLMIQVRDPVENLIMSIAQKARAAGIHLIIGTQRPSVNVITGVIKANIPSRIACKVSSNVDSRTIIEQAGAEKLLNNGDMLFWPVGKPKPIRVQGAFVSDGEVKDVIAYLKAQTKGDAYDSVAIEEINRAAQKCVKKKDSDFDRADSDGEDSDGLGYLNNQKFLDAVELAISQEKISTSLIQRKIGLGYGKAAKFIDIMESLGIVGEPNGQKPREVLLSRDEWHEKLSRLSID